LKNGSTTARVMETVAAVARTGAPTLVMSYWNPIERFGVDAFASELAKAGGVGVITPDLTPEEAAAWTAATDREGIDRVFLVAPSSTDARLRVVCDATTGFVYAASTMGVTGARTSVSHQASDLVKRTRTVTTLPISVGLGVSTGEQASEIAQYADGVIVGSAFVRALLDASSPTEGVSAVSSLAAELAAGVRRRLR
jgi:tryptophan synthase alpha chain